MEQLAAQLAATVTVLQTVDRAAVERLVGDIGHTHRAGGTIFVCGNGGSASTATHFAQDLGKSTMCGHSDRERLRVLALTDNVSGLTAWANDNGYETVFEQPLRALGRPGDLLVAISGSGNSPNVLNAVRYAKESGIRSFAWTGFDGGRLRSLADDVVHVDVADMEITENVHLVVAHLVVCGVRAWKRQHDGAA